MDPTACYRLLLKTLQDHNWGEAAEHAENLLEWKRGGGFAPEGGTSECPVVIINPKLFTLLVEVRAWAIRAEVNDHG